jgi:hypothetical protein
MNKLEEYIRKNRDDLDKYTPSANIWRRINKELNKRKSPFIRWLSIAAMVMVVFGTAAILFKTVSRKSGESKTFTSETETVRLNPQLNETELYYNNLVNSLYRSASPLLTANPEIEKELKSDFSQLDSICADIKKDLKDNVANQEVVEALIQNYTLKIRLLEDMLNILKENENNTGKNKSYEL